MIKYFERMVAVSYKSFVENLIGDLTNSINLGLHVGNGKINQKLELFNLDFKRWSFLFLFSAVGHSKLSKQPQ